LAKGKGKGGGGIVHHVRRKSLNRRGEEARARNQTRSSTAGVPVQVGTKGEGITYSSNSVPPDFSEGEQGARELEDEWEGDHMKAKLHRTLGAAG